MESNKAAIQTTTTTKENKARKQSCGEIKTQTIYRYLRVRALRKFYVRGLV